MMTDRELIVRAIAQAIADNIKSDVDTVLKFTSRSLHQEADAVLDAIGHRLLPELPDSIHNVDVFIPRSGVRFGEYRVEVFEFGGLAKRREGHGPTIPAAIRNALEDSK